MHKGIFNKSPLLLGLVNTFQLSDANGNLIAIAGEQMSLSDFAGNTNYKIYDPERKNMIAEINMDLSGTGIKDMFKNLAGHAYLVNINQKLISTLNIIEFVLAIDLRAEFQGD